LPHGKQAARPSRSASGAPRQQAWRTRKASKEVSEKHPEVALPVPCSSDAATRSETYLSSASASAGGVSAVSSRGSKPATSDASVEAMTILESFTTLMTQHPHGSSSLGDAKTTEETSSGSPKISVPLLSENILSPTLHYVTGITSTKTGTNVSGSVTHVLPENVLSSGMRSVAARKQYSSLSSSLVERSVCVSEQESTSTSTRDIVVGSSLSAGSGVLSQQSSSPVSSETDMFKSQFSDDSAFISTSATEKLDERTVRIAPPGSLESKLTVSTSTTLYAVGSDALRPVTRSSLESLATPSSSRGAFMLLRSSLRPRTLRLGLKSKLKSSLVEGDQKVGQAGKSFPSQEVKQSEERAETKKDIKNKENIQRQKETSISESSQEKGMEESSGSQSSNEDSAMEIESGPHGKLAIGVRKKEGYTCPVCLMLFGNLMKLSQHVESHSGLSGSSSATSGILPSNPGGSNGKKKGNHICHVCSKAFISLGKLSQHIEFHTNTKFEELEMFGFTGIRGGGGKRRSGHTCRVCSKVFVSPGRLSNHMYSAHPGLSSSSSSVGALTTPSVSAVASVSGVKRKGNHVCPICSKVFGSPGKLSQHMYSHTGERPFACSECNKAFSSKFKLVRHALIHSSDSERRYRCNACDRSFHRKDHLQNHAKVSFEPL
jgi:hypothetical protein